MKKLGILILSVGLCLGLKGQKIEKKTLETVEEFIDHSVSQFDIPGLVVGIVENGQLQHVFSKGEYKRGSEKPLDADAPFQIASLSKSFTAIIANSLSLEGNLDLDKLVSEYLIEDLGVQKSKTFNQISLKNLLQHRSGLPHDGASIPPTPNGKAMIGGYSKDAFLKDLSNLTIDQDKVGSFSYSNLGFALIGFILEKETGLTYELLLQKYVLEPYNLKSTTSDLEAVRKELVTPYHVHKRGSETAPWEMGMAIPAGGLVSTVGDLSKLLVAEMAAYRQYKKDGIVTSLILTHEKLPLNDYANYGYGFFDGQNPNDANITQLGHGGDIDGFGSFFEFYPDLNMGLILLTSSGGTWFNDLKGDIEKLILKQQVRRSISLSKSELKKFIGRYDFGENRIMNVFRRGQFLMTSLNGSTAVRLYPESETQFFYKSMNSGFEFELDKKGKVKKTTYWQGEEKFYPKKIR